MSGKGLGRGLDALFGDIVQPADTNTGVSAIPISKIEPNNMQPRRTFTEESLQELADSIRKNGVISPITVRRLTGGQYQIVAGERRWRASKLAGLKEIPAVVVDVDDKNTMILAMVENLQREDLNPIEEAEGYRTLIEDYGMKQEQAAERVGKSRPAIANALRLLGLPEQVQQMVAKAELSAGHARAILALDEQDMMLEAAQKIKNEQLSVRAAENYIKKLLQQAQKRTPKEQQIAVNYLEDLEKQLAQRLGRKINIAQGRKKGKIEIEFYGNDDLERLTKALLNLNQ